MDPKPGDTTIDENAEVDTVLEAGLGEISSDLFGQESGDGDSAAAGETTPAGEGQQEAVQSAETVVPPQDLENSAEVQGIGAPQTWTKEAIAEWAAVPDRVKQEIQKREDDMMRGIESYKTRAEIGDSYSKVVEPYSAALAAEGVNPVELFNAFAGNHYLLSRGTPEQKITIAGNLLQHYGIDVGALLDHLGSYTPPTAAETAAQAELRELRSRLDAQDNERLSAARAEADCQIEAFMSDPANVYAVEVAADISALLQSGAAKDLKSAYDLAVFQNPVTRQKEIDRITAEKISAQTAAQGDKTAKAVKALAANVTTSPKTRDGTVPVGTMDETLEETYAAIQARG